MRGLDGHQTHAMETLGRTPRGSYSRKGVLLPFIGSAKTDPVRFKRGFGEGRLKDKFAFFEACKNPIPKRRKLLAERAFFISKKGPVKKPL